MRSGVTASPESLTKNSARHGAGGRTRSACTAAHESLRQHSGPVAGSMLCADWDAPSTWKVAYPDGSAAAFTRDEFLAGVPFIDGITSAVVESAHLKERNPYSVAQVYTREELESWRPPCPVYLFPARLAPKVGDYAGNDKTRDAESLRVYLTDHPRVLRCLKVFYPPSRDPRRHTWEWRDETRLDITLMLNILRAQWKGMSDAEMDAIPAVAHCRALVDSFIDSLPDSALEQFRMKRGRVGQRKGDVMFVSPTQIMTAYACVHTADCKMRVNPSGGFMGVHAVLNDVVGLSHSHMPNLARANFMHFGLRPLLRNTPTARWQPARAEFMRNLRLVVRQLRDASIRSELAAAPESLSWNSGRNAGALTRSAFTAASESLRGNSEQSAGLTLEIA